MTKPLMHHLVKPLIYFKKTLLSICFNSIFFNLCRIV